MTKVMKPPFICPPGNTVGLTQNPNNHSIVLPIMKLNCLFHLEVYRLVRCRRFFAILFFEKKTKNKKLRT